MITVDRRGVGPSHPSITSHALTFALGTFLIAFGSSRAHADDQGVDVRIELGVALARPTYTDSFFEDELLDPKTSVGLIVGSTVSFGLGHRVRAQTGLLYQQKGGGTSIAPVTFQDGSVLSDAELTWELHYVSIPAVLVVDCLKRSTRTLYAGVGMEFDILVSATGKSKSTTTLPGGEAFTSESERDIRDELEKLDFAPRILLGLELPVGQRSGFLEIRYSLGLQNVIKEDIVAGIELKNRVVGIVAGLTI